MALNLDAIRTVNESFMADECIVTRDVEQERDDIWDEVSGEYVPPPVDTITVYQGKCMVYPNTGFTERIRGGSSEKVTAYWLEVPVVNTGFLANDLVKVTVSLNDPGLVGEEFFLDTEESDTYAASRRIRMHDRRSIPK